MAPVLWSSLPWVIYLNQIIRHTITQYLSISISFFLNFVFFNSIWLLLIFSFLFSFIYSCVLKLFSSSSLTKSPFSELHLFSNELTLSNFLPVFHFFYSFWSNNWCEMFSFKCLKVWKYTLKSTLSKKSLGTSLCSSSFLNFDILCSDGGIKLILCLWSFKYFLDCECSTWGTSIVLDLKFYMEIYLSSERGDNGLGWAGRKVPL